MSGTQGLYFGKIMIPTYQIFVQKKNVFGTVNLKPFSEGHVLVIPKRYVKRIYELTEIETLDLWITASEVAKVMTKIYKRDCEIVIQDGPQAGQTIDHVHAHIIPKQICISAVDNEKRVAQTEEEMTTEANKYRPYFEQNNL